MEEILKNDRKSKAAFKAPDVEVIVRADEQELSVIAFYSAAEGEWDVLCGVSDTADREHVAAALRYAADAIEKANFPVSATPPYRGYVHDEDGDNDLPF